MFLFETGYCYVAQADLEVMILLPQPLLTICPNITCIVYDGLSANLTHC